MPGLAVQDGFKQGQYWDTDEPYHYVRAVEHNGDLVLVVGGENHKTGIKPHEYEVWFGLRRSLAVVMQLLYACKATPTL
jgi:hypothetical protein